MKIEAVDHQKYLGFVISKDGNNMENIKSVKCKSLGIISKVIHRLESAKLGKYYFEAADN